MDEATIEGGCYCGDLRFRASGPVLHATMCHCANCRRAAGAHAVAWITVRADRFAFTRGEPARYRTETAAWRTFCPRCGTSMTYQADNRTDQIDITTGSLDHPEDFPPTQEVWTEEKLPWA